ncbi:contact-dependent growth inhibition system immunity protein [Streptomyces sp. E2N166]|uniref:contact-dependent growth inhibition system immunity protein n=1 Tax=Streptomyces sp. E2N166 TaxID=1851909 RepID=UPI000EF69BFE|nr:contact-dependent growth inhibition system immunity protein [Streptomyces sp. E2N166]
MSQSLPPGHRFHELSDLLEAYACADFTFSDTAEAPGPALSAYLRTAARDPARAATAIRQIDDLLSVGLFSEEIADEVELLPHIRPPMGASVEECLRVVRGHLHRLLRDPSQIPQVNPQSAWEWNERFPSLGQLLGAYFHRDFSDIYASREEALDEYVSEAEPEDRVQTAQEIGELLTMMSSDQELRTATTALGLDLLPPRGMSLRKWLESIRRRIAAA